MGKRECDGNAEGGMEMKEQGGEKRMGRQRRREMEMGTPRDGGGHENGKATRRMGRQRKIGNGGGEREWEGDAE